MKRQRANTQGVARDVLTEQYTKGDVYEIPTRRLNEAGLREWAAQRWQVRDGKLFFVAEDGHAVEMDSEPDCESESSRDINGVPKYRKDAKIS